MNDSAADSNKRIPKIKRDGRLISRLLPVLIVGAEKSLDNESRLYLRSLVRLVDKSAYEYEIAREYLLEEIQTGDKLKYRLSIINHLENSINAVNRVMKTLDIILNGKKDSKNKKTVLNNFNLLSTIDDNTLNHLQSYSVSTLRNRIEHLDEDIFDNTASGGLFVDVDETYENICILGRCLPISEFVSHIEASHNLVLQILSKLK